MSQYIINSADLSTTVTTAAGSATVNASGFTPEDVLNVGDWIIFGADADSDGDGISYTIASVGASSFTLTAPYPTTRTAIDAVVHRNFTNIGGITLPHFENGDLGAAVIFTRAIEAIAAALGAGFVAKGLILAEQTTPPGGPSTGDAYIVTATATGAWAGQEGEIATWDGSAWTFSGTPATGWWVYNADTDTVRIYAGGQWNDWTVNLTSSGSGNRVYAVEFVPLSEVTASGNLGYMQAKIRLRNGGLVMGAQIVKSQGKGTAGVTEWSFSDVDYGQAGSPQTETLQIAYNANQAVSSGWSPILIPSDSDVYIFCSAVDASGGHQHTSILLEVFE